jgi:hypothetical protein
VADLSDAEFERRLEDEAERVASALLALPPEARAAALRRWVRGVHDLVVRLHATEIDNATVDDVIRGDDGA